jgi:hypothetical protein
MQLQRISKILVQFSAWSAEAKSAREFLTRVSSANTRKSNPQCQVEAVLRSAGCPASDAASSAILQPLFPTLIFSPFSFSKFSTIISYK